MQSKVKVSICVAYYNRADRVQASIGSLLSQNFDDFEVIVVNDGSPDQNVEEQLSLLSDTRLRVINQKNAGFVAAMNKAISKARGEYIAIHGAGDISLPNRIKRQSRFLDENAEVGLVSCLFDNVVIGGEADGTRVSKAKPFKVDVNDLLGFDNPFSQGEVMFRKDLFNQVGGYREYFKYAQDRDLWLRMIDHTEMRIIQEKLYERGIFIKDGVAAIIEKNVVQKYLASLARACYKSKKAGEGDLVEKYGAHAGFFRPADSLLSKYFAIQSVESVLKGNDKKAELFRIYAMREKKTVYALLANIFVMMSKIAPLRIIMKKTILAVYPNSAKKYRT